MSASVLPFKVLGFALAVRDLESLNMGMPRQDIVDALLTYAAEYDKEREAFYAVAEKQHLQ